MPSSKSALELIRDKLARVPNWTKLGVIGAIITFISAAGFNAVTLPWKGAADSSSHLAYVERLTDGELPSPPSAVAAHPPLFYWLATPFMGPYIADDSESMAVAVGRILNIGIGVVTVLALAWAGWLLGGKRRNQLAVALPALAVLWVPYIKVAGDIYNDALATLLSVISLTITAIIIKNGLNRKLFGWILFISVLGMLTRATFLSTLLITLLAIPLSLLIHHTGPRIKRLIKGGALSSSLLVAAVVATGWYYSRNYNASGSWFRSRPKRRVGSREEQDFFDVITDPDFYIVIPGRLLGIRQWDTILPINMQVSLAISIICFAGICYWVMKKRLWQKITQNMVMLSVLGLLLLQLVLLQGQQLQHAIGWGNINPRYFLTGMLPVGLFLAYGSLAWEKLRGMLVVIFMAVFCAAVIINSAWFLDGRYRSVAKGENSWTRALVTTQENGFDLPVLLLLVAGMTAGIVFVGLSLFNLSRSKANIS